jgi:hypothetical protein
VLVPDRTDAPRPCAQTPERRRAKGSPRGELIDESSRPAPTPPRPKAPGGVEEADTRAVVLRFGPRRTAPGWRCSMTLLAALDRCSCLDRGRGGRGRPVAVDHPGDDLDLRHATCD